MLAENQLPQNFLDWNAQQGAPYGKPIILAKKLKRWLPSTWYWSLRGPFSVQRNNTTRAFEYPWAFFQAQVSPGDRILEVGGSLSGFQFALAQHGCRVVNIDPGFEAAGKGWHCDQDTLAKLNRLFHTDVELRNTTIEKAELPSDAFDCAFSISVIEHLPWGDVENVMRETFRSLKPGGRFILTVDLFTDVAPFQTAQTNKYGANINIKELAAVENFELVFGEKTQLYGYTEFEPQRILTDRDRFLVGGGYPAMVQCLVLKKPEKETEY
ncbi:class I SAM-dependent methyltransferase [Exilibacterium tricleocarpae]|uniref:Class I SAM-dependent methyltransferase n=1 Tax=Exilibacterium tricleocarpae TaxID=2591008 RepID=A0A545TKB3_9GAMM|nr:class I SAM-dependent methyltransferase [Exilibacterium tricleocarpae]TQV77647.1 class I SAM-dependent methyltransferase [Exilibacterium tricleocarpae]